MLTVVQKIGTDANAIASCILTSQYRSEVSHEAALSPPRPARRFDVGEKCTALLPGAIAALEQLQTWGVGNVARVLGQINDRIASRLGALGFALPPPSQRCPHFVGGRVPPGTARDVVGSLRAQHVFISQRRQSIRLAPHLHVTEPDVEQLFAALDVVVASSTPAR